MRSFPVINAAILVCLLQIVEVVAFSRAFKPSSPIRRSVGANAPGRQQRLSMAPRFDPSTEKWSPTNPDEETSAGYDAIGSLIRQGPKPFFQRVFQPDLYDQAVLKFMAKEGVSRDEAQGNMDAYLSNPNDWAFQYYEERNGGAKYDYVNAPVKPKALALTGVWSVLVLGILGRMGYSLKEGVDFYDFL